MNRANDAAVQLRGVQEDDLPVFFEQQLDSAANRMAAFTRKDPTDRASFDAHWTKILNDKTVRIMTILYRGAVAGYVASFQREGEPEITYWIGKEFWRKGVATHGLSVFLSHANRRPIFARVAKDNAASVRVLEKCGFKVCGADRGFSNARGEEVDELILELKVGK